MAVNIPLHAKDLPGHITGMVNDFNARNYFGFGTNLSSILCDLVGDKSVLDMLKDMLKDVVIDELGRLIDKYELQARAKKLAEDAKKAALEVAAKAKAAAEAAALKIKQEAEAAAAKAKALAAEVAAKAKAAADAVAARARQVAAEAAAKAKAAADAVANAAKSTVSKAKKFFGFVEMQNMKNEINAISKL